MQVNGVFILQTFLSADISEEEQIKGRTCRQGAKGRYKMVLLSDDLVQWGTDDKKQQLLQAHDAKAKPAHAGLGLAAKDISRLQSMNSLDSYQELDQKRRAWFSLQAEQRQKDVQNALARHMETEQFQRLLCSNQRTANRNSDIMNFLLTMNSGKSQGASSQASSHLIFCLDESGSMSGGPWEELLVALQAFLRVRIDAGSADIVSVVQFDDKARQTLSCESLGAALATNFILRGGGTNFKPAIGLATQAAAAQALPCMVIFMSDGGNGDGKVDKEMRRLQKQCSNGFQFHAVYFGASDSPRLQVALFICSACMALFEALHIILCLMC